MARPREFETADALEQAMRAFWAKGYQATSLRDLTGAMGLSKSSLYETFGSKHALFVAAIDHYIDTMIRRAEAGLDGAASAPAAIAELFGDVIDSAVARNDRRGCFVCNSAVEVSPHDSEAAARVRVGLDRLERAFQRAVVRGQKAGDIGAEHDPGALARYLTSSLNGLHVVAKANPDRAALEDVARIVLSALD